VGVRPTEYNPNVVERAKKYLVSCQDDDSNPLRLKVKLPSIEGLALYLDIDRDTVYAWQKKHTEFSDIVKKVLCVQAQRLLENGLSGAYNASISKLILTKHGYSDKQDVELSGDQSKPILHRIERVIVDADNKN